MIRTVLVVDDSPVDRKYLGQILGDIGLKVLTANSGREGVELAHKARPDLIFMDIVMPEMDGYQACRDLHGDPATRHIPVIFVSSKNQEADRIWAEMQGGGDYVCKPYTADTIVGAIQKFGKDT
ncbi:response regulator [Methylomagnum ishizawai]|uniref:response regulator n=1 Tax=Methylomagnum ishizawai TaxID=1760988 RepID=UPI001C325A96|nr:response regulator [Methylomagnum ishizawai]BBL76042.1 response regulator [Methylomagnum ishizawai]